MSRENSSSSSASEYFSAEEEQDFLCSIDEAIQYIQGLAYLDGIYQSPVDLRIKYSTPVDLPLLRWINFDKKPRKMKITNTGHTVLVRAECGVDRPYIVDGPLSGPYVFSQIHFHWGEDDNRGSEHLVEGKSFPMEMHAVFFKARYLKQEDALREKDGLAVLAYFLKLQDEPNEDFEPIVNSLRSIEKPHTSVHLNPANIQAIVKPFKEDYLLYWGSVHTSKCAHIMQWFICREPVGISSDQINHFRQIRDLTDEPLRKNYKDVQEMESRILFHVLPSERRETVLL